MQRGRGGATIGVALAKRELHPFVIEPALQAQHLPQPFDVLVTGLAIIGLIASIARRHVVGVALGLTGIAAVVLVYLTRDSLPVIGLLWNPRVLPLLYLLPALPSPRRSFWYVR